MIPASRSAVRMASAGCLAAAALLLALAGCGGDTPAKAGDPPTSLSTPAPASTPTAKGPTDRRCERQVGGFLASMDGLRERLVSGLSYEQYVEAIDAIRADYDGVPVGRLSIDCLVGSGTPGEKAFGKYLAAANSWGECIGDSGCDAATVEPVLQRQWRVASHFLDEAQSGLGA